MGFRVKGPGASKLVPGFGLRVEASIAFGGLSVGGLTGVVEGFRGWV